MFISKSQLSSAEYKAVEQLLAACRKHDAGVPAIYSYILLQKRDSETTILYYQQNQLIGFLSIYFFYEDACEVTLMVAPEHRHQGIASQLLARILPLLTAKQIPNLIFSITASLDNQWLKQRKLAYKNSEYHMEREGYEAILLANPALVIHKATLATIPTLCAIDELCFPQAVVDMPTRFTNLLNDKNYTIIIAQLGHVAVGKAHIRWQDKCALLSDIAVVPQHQRQGLGSELLAYCINYALTLGHTKIALDVETFNKNALNLYLRHGFKITDTTDFWVISVDKLRTYLK